VYTETHKHIHTTKWLSVSAATSQNKRCEYISLTSQKAIFQLHLRRVGHRRAVATVIRGLSTRSEVISASHACTFSPHTAERRVFVPLVDREPGSFVHYEIASVEIGLLLWSHHLARWSSGRPCLRRRD